MYGCSPVWKKLLSFTGPHERPNSCTKCSKPSRASSFQTIFLDTTLFRGAQQKCLIHLMRDINDDLRKHPFDQEIREIAEGFACLLRPMVASVDRFGLKARHLRKHWPAVEKFFSTLEKRDYQTEVAVAYRKRFEKNRN